MDQAAREEGPVDRPDATAETAAPAPTDRPTRRLGRYGVFGILFLIIGAGGLWADYNLDWWSATQERTVPILGVVNEGAPWVDYERAELEELYVESTFYTQGNLLWPWAAWVATIAAGILLLASELLGRWPRTQTTTRTLVLTVQILALGMMLINVSRRLGSWYINRHYNGIVNYAWEEVIWIQLGGGLVLLAAASYLLWHLRRTHPPVAGHPVGRPHHNALAICVLTVLLIGGVLVVSPWVPHAQFHLPAIVGDQWWGESAIHNMADGGDDRGLAGKGYMGAMRALYVSAGTAALSALGVAAWQRTTGRARGRVWGLVAQTHLLAIFPLHLGLSGYGVYVAAMHRIDRVELLANQFVGQAILILLVTWVAHVMWILVPYLKRWPRPAPAALPLDEHEGRETGDVVPSD